MAIATANQPIKAINQLRPGKRPESDADHSPQIQQYTEEPGLHRFRASNQKPGYAHISNAGTSQVSLSGPSPASSVQSTLRRSSARVRFFFDLIRHQKSHSHNLTIFKIRYISRLFFYVSLGYEKVHKRR